MNWRIQHVLHRRGPTALMLGSLAVVGILLLQPLHGVPGYAEVEPVRLASLEAGVVASVSVVPGQVVAAGDIVGVLDDGPIQGRIRVLRAELARQSATLQDAEAGARTTARTAQSDLTDAATRLSGARESLALARERLEARERQVSMGLETRASLGPLVAEVAELHSEAKQLAGLYQRRKQSLDEASMRIDAGDADAAPAVLTEVRARGVVHEELAALLDRQKQRTLRAPVDARVATVNYRVGEVLPPLTAFVELLPLETKTVSACLPEQFAQAVPLGSSATMLPAAGGEARVGVVVDVVGLVSEAPQRCKQRPNEIGWIRPVRIAVDGSGLVPGQRFDVTFEPPVEGETL